MALGQEIVCELGLEARGTVIDRWLAHHLAELMVEANTAVGADKAAAEKRAVGLILKLWRNRRGLPVRVDPLGGLREAISVLGRLAPDADPWRRFRRSSYDDLLHEMFESMCRVVMGGLLLTHLTHPRPISDAESSALEEEELFLVRELEQWRSFFVAPAPPARIDLVFVDADDVQEEKSGDDSDSNGEARSSTEEPLTDASVHELIAANLERIQSDLADLLARWRKTASEDRSPDDDTLAELDEE